MPDLNIVTDRADLVVAPGANQLATVTARGIAGANILSGQVVYVDPNANGLLKPAQANVQLQAANVVGIAVDNAAPGQPLTYATGGDLILQTSGTGSTLMSGSVYVLSAGTAGNLISTADPFAAGNYVSVLEAI